MKNSNNYEYHKLLVAISAGDEKAFEKLYDLFWPALLNHILSKINDKQVAEDIIHDLYLSLWNKRSNILRIESVPAYLYSACRNRIFTYLRKCNQEKHCLFADEQIPDKEECIEERLYYRYLLDLVDKEIEDLPEKCREVFKLSRFSNLSNKEIGERLVISESTVENHINKAIKRLRVSTNKSLFFLYFFF